MGETTEIRWTDSTFNPWWGCARVSEACQHCYAESFAKRVGQDVWGKGGNRRFFGEKHWTEPLRWNQRAEKAGVPRLVFCASMADVFEDHPTLHDERERLWDLVCATPWLTWQLLTKRPENILEMVPSAWLPRWPANVWAGTTVETQRWADERLPYLAKVPAPVRFVSAEPLLGPIDLARNFRPEWVIAGGESGPKARAADPDWFRSLRDQCRDFGIPYLFKQWGEWLPREEGMVRVGKKAAGFLLDGRTWDEMPRRVPAV